MGEEALDRTQWRTRLGRSCGLVLRKTSQLMQEIVSRNVAKKPLFIFGMLRFNFVVRHCYLGLRYRSCIAAG